MTTFIRPTIHLADVYEALIAAYGTPRNEPDFNPLGGLIGTILSQHTSDINSERAYQQLISAFPTWEAVRDAPTYQIAEAIWSQPTTFFMTSGTVITTSQRNGQSPSEG